MEFNKEIFEKALKANKIVRYQKHFEAVVKSYLEIENQALRQPLVVGLGEQCAHEYKVDDKSDIPFDLICAKCGKNGYGALPTTFPRLPSGQVSERKTVKLNE